MQSFKLLGTTRLAGGFLQPYKGLLPAASKGAGFHSVQAQCRYHFGLPLEGVGILACCQLILHDVMPFLLLDVFLYRCFIESYRTHIIPFGPKFSVAEFVLQVCVPIKNHQGTFALQISHETRHADLWRDTHQHVNMIGHKMSFYDINSLIPA